jgi:ferredoxin
MGLCPEVFELHDDGYAIVLVSDVPSELEDSVRQAVSQCPARAISLSDDHRK